MNNLSVVLYGLYVKLQMYAFNVNPLDIATNAEGNGMTVVREGEDSFFQLFQLGKLFAWLKRDGLILASIVILFLLITMLFVNKAEKLADKKADIMHKLLIVFLISSVLWILDVIVVMLDKVF